MTLYIRPVKIAFAEPEIDHGILNLANIEIIITAKRQQEWVHWFTFTINLTKTDKETKIDFIGFNPNMQHRISLRRKPRSIRSRLNKEHLSEETQINLKKWIQKFSGSKSKIQQKEVTVDKFKLTFEFKYNKWMQICGNSTFQQFSLEKDQSLEYGEDQVQFCMGECTNKNLFSRFDSSSLPENKVTYSLTEQPYIKN